MIARTAKEWVALAIAIVVAGVGITFGVAIIGSWLGLPPVAIAGLSFAGIVAIIYPVLRPAKGAPADAPDTGSGKDAR